VYFCQDCGGANAANAESCRICGKALVRERDGAPCLRCGGATAEAANFCSLCGATTVQPVSAAPSAHADADDTVVAFNQLGAQQGNDLNLGEGLELPEWLKRAAAEQPFDASRQTAINANPYGPAGGGTVTLDAVHADGADVAPATDFVLSPEPPLSIPRDATDSVISQGAAGSQGAGGVASSDSDASDTSTFISENDLPELSRKIAAADEARRLEEIRLANEQSAASGAAGANDPRNRKPLPGETQTTGPGTSPWLARRDRSEETDTVAADSWGKPAAEKREAPQDTVVAPASAEPAPTPVVADSVVAAAAATGESSQNRMRMILMAAVVAAVLAVVAFMVLS
jgi:hypothetical protein